MATGIEIQDDLNAIVGFDENFNNAIVRHSLDLKDQAIFRNPDPINVTFHDMKKFDLVNPVIGKLATQVKASKLTDYQLTKKLLQQGEIDELQLRLDKLKYGVDKDDGKKGSSGTGSGGGGGDEGTHGPFPPQTPQQEMEEICRRLDALKGNTLDVSPYNTSAQNPAIISQKNNEKIVNQQIRETNREIANAPKGIVTKRKSATDFNFPDTLPQTPGEDYWQSIELLSVPPISRAAPVPSAPPLFNYEKYFVPLSRRPIELPSLEQCENSFGDFGTISPLRNKLSNIVLLPSKPSVDNFSGPITQLIDEKNNTIEITPKKSVLLPIGQKQLSEQVE